MSTPRWVQVATRVAKRSCARAPEASRLPAQMVRSLQLQPDDFFVHFLSESPPHKSKLKTHADQVEDIAVPVPWATTPMTDGASRQPYKSLDSQLDRPQDESMLQLHGRTKEVEGVLP